MGRSNKFKRNTKTCELHKDFYSMLDTKENGGYTYFYNLWDSIDNVGSLREIKNGYDIIVDFGKGFYVRFYRYDGQTMVASINYYYSYGYKNVNLATIENIRVVVVKDVSVAKRILCSLCEVINSFIYKRMDNKEDMIKEQERNLRKQRVIAI